MVVSHFSAFDITSHRPSIVCRRDFKPAAIVRKADMEMTKGHPRGSHENKVKRCDLSAPKWSSESRLKSTVRPSITGEVDPNRERRRRWQEVGTAEQGARTVARAHLAPSASASESLEKTSDQLFSSQLTDATRPHPLGDHDVSVIVKASIMRMNELTIQPLIRLGSDRVTRGHSLHIGT